MRIYLTGVLAALALIITSSVHSMAKEPVYQSLFGGAAINGFDPVAYFKERRPVEGSSELTYDWNGATWRFANSTNRDRFAAHPEAFAPQYGGYCAWAVSQGYTASTDPEAWKIVDGKLYLNYSKSVQARWEEDLPENIAKGNANWPKVLE
ncbi:YHS domain protein [Limibaculum sp. FT325]|uniref:YHS domain-containing (seleno)protein n=1 Tax=Thermohalobaculum sediminis TaxID=2939436 RepID=UPI0020BFF3FF|nr:YHS domain-containing (seleno)protein [Limibaculum sediminis]MCL5779222.1 YHS domain protein [Limibaculum sediminis]